MLEGAIERLQDEDIIKLADAFQNNKKFNGPLILSNNPLSDIAALHVGRILREGNNIKKLVLNQDAPNRFTNKTGEYIGQALLDNPASSISKLSFEGIYLDNTGLQRIVEAVNACKSIEKLHVGVITDSGLRILAEGLMGNESLEELEFSETDNHQRYWT